MAVDFAKTDFVLAIDMSGSMSQSDCPNGVSRWQYAKEYAEGLANKLAKIDDDGFDLYFFNNGIKAYEQATSAIIEKAYQELDPMGGTDTTKVLKTIVDKHFKEAKGKNLCVLILTDGEPNDRASLKKLIVDTTKKLNNDDEMGISFLQIGKDTSAKRFLKELDDDLEAQGAKFDIVDTKDSDALDGMSINEVLIAAFEE